MKRIISILLILPMLFALSACGKSDNGGSSSSDASGRGEYGYTGGEYTLVVVSHNTEAVAEGSGILKLAELIETYSDGKIKCDIYTDGSLGTQVETASEVRSGGIDIAENDWATMASTNGYLKGSVVSLGYMFEDYDHVMAFYQSDLMAQMNEELIEQCGIRCLAGAASATSSPRSLSPRLTIWRACASVYLTLKSMSTHSKLWAARLLSSRTPRLIQPCKPAS